MNTPVEQLDFLLALFRPLLTPAEVAFVLDDCSERHVLDLIDEGKLRAVNIASDVHTRRTLRIYRYSVEHAILAPDRPLTIVPPEHILPHQRPTILRREFASLLGCTEQHVSNLNLDGPRDRGSDTRHRIYRHAAIDFLTSREFTP